MEILSGCSRTFHVCLDEWRDSENHGESFTKWEWVTMIFNPTTHSFKHADTFTILKNYAKIIIINRIVFVSAHGNTLLHMLMEWK